MRPMPRRSRRPCNGPACGSFPSRRPISRPGWSCIERGICSCASKLQPHQCVAGSSRRVRDCRTGGAWRRRAACRGHRGSQGQALPIRPRMPDALAIQLDAIKEQIAVLDRRLAGWHRRDETCKRLDAIPGVGRHWPLRLSPALPMRTRSNPGATSRPGSDWCRSRTRATARRDSAASRKPAIDICDPCSVLARLPSSDMRRSAAPGIGPGSRGCSSGGR